MNVDKYLDLVEEDFVDHLIESHSGGMDCPVCNEYLEDCQCDSDSF